MRPNEPKQTSGRPTEQKGAPSPPLKEDSRIVRMLKKTGFTVWLAVMVIGGALAFIVALFLV